MRQVDRKYISISLRKPLSYQVTGGVRGPELSGGTVDFKSKFSLSRCIRPTAPANHGIQHNENMEAAKCAGSHRYFAGLEERGWELFLPGRSTGDDVGTPTDIDARGQSGFRTHERVAIKM